MIRYDPNSAEAWDRFRKGGGELTINGLIIRELATGGPQTCEQVRSNINAKHQTVSAQIRHLQDDNEIAVYGHTENEDGQTVNVYSLPNQLPQQETEMALDFAKHVVLTCGSRTYDNAREVRVQLEMLPESTWIVHGACRGADTLVQEIALDIGIPTMGEPANWSKYGKAAGPIRNKHMIEEYSPEACLAFCDKRKLEDSHGTWNMVGLAREAGIPVRVFGGGTSLRDTIKWRRKGII